MTISITRKKVQREEVKVMISVGSIHLTMLNAWEAFNGVKGIFVWNSQLNNEIKKYHCKCANKFSFRCFRNGDHRGHKTT
jgi:hypothetical protein